MLIAYNNDIEYKSRWFHVQTEDNGIKDGHITTTVFLSGQTLDSKSTSYLEPIEGITDEEQINAIIKALMVKQHQVFATRLCEGYYDAQIEKRTQTTTPNPGKSQIGLLTTKRPPSDSSLGSAQKPDILRASQQLSGISKLSKLGLSTKSSSDSGSPLRRIPSQIRLSPPATLSPSVSTDVNFARSKGVENECKLAKTKVWRGVTWGTEDLAIDSIVATLLENGSLS
ncbi:MAG: hypothetical protein IJU23_13945 [Proteobacteria bacterium]|nr:hypothetical protein [Pseudomonadota bacterium]